MIKWKRTTLGQVVSEGNGLIQTGPFGSQLHASDYVENGIPCIMPANMKESRVNLSGIARISVKDAQRLSQHLVKPGDIVYSRRGDITQKVLIHDADNGFFCGTGCILIRPGNNVDSRFLTYFLGARESKEWLINHSVGITMPNLNTKILFNLPLRLPSKNHQIEIADILSAIDKKIEVNNRINAELEAMAKTLYDYWFVQFDFPDENGKPYKSSGGKMLYSKELKREIPAGWEVSNILKVAELFGGGTPSKNDLSFWNGEIPFFTPTDTSQGVFQLDTEEHITEDGLKSCSSLLFDKGTVFITARGSVGKLALTARKMAMNQSCYALKPKAGCGGEFVYFLTQELIHHLKIKSSGSVFKSIVSNDIKFTQMCIPDNQAIQTYSEVIEPLFEKILNCSKENQRLVALRDWLLPMLMNGQVRVESAADDLYSQQHDAGMRQP
ncbi:restriction endonuclease subunit S [Thiothrix litoralis]|jgi:type I restriction enzyme S subunit|uniref:Restriction endonuclease subunit S n=1 Tax=Thiothrix litoralis TaxID=2891210 RepID=A0ABX7WWZ2_9GAMM|nr:restriction endonuclease subunit S [Thiothrix litoralis]QTR46908.1 restriction endonuclease subunit S [Thiothrix litoralis]